MDKPSSTALSDWAVLTLRWVFIMGVCVWLAFGETVDWVVLSILGVATLGNILATIIVVTNRTSFQFRLVSTIGDFIFTQALFFLSLNAGAGRELTWVALLSQISASLFFQWPGMLIALVLNTALIGWQVFYQVPDPEGLIIPFSVWALVYLIVRRGNGLREWTLPPGTPLP